MRVKIIDINISKEYNNLVIKTPNKTITLKEIAERCQVSTWTVSSALRKNPRVNKDTLARICNVAEEMGYDPYTNSEARQLSLRNTDQHVINRIIALIFPSYFPEVTFYSQIFQGILGVFAQKDYAVVTTYLPNNQDIVPIYQVFGRGLVDGLLFYSGLADVDHLITKLRKIVRFGEKPCISLLRDIQGCSSVLADNTQGTYLATQHLLDQGHRHIMQTVFFIDKNGTVESGNRVEGAKKALIEAGLTPEIHLHLIPWGGEWLDPLSANRRLTSIISMPVTNNEQIHPLIQYLNIHPEITAILTRNDAEALHIWEILEQAGKHVPNDISLIGFDDTDAMLDDRGNNLLTSVRLPLVRVGEEAAQMMLRQIQNEYPEIEKIVLPASLVERFSTAPPKKSKMA